MSHRAQQIIEAIELALQTASIGVNDENILAFRSLSLADDQAQLPAVTIHYGNDEPSSMSQWDAVWSDLGVEIAAYDAKSDEKDLHHSLLELRRQIHRALIADSTLGLSFVLSIRYAGAEKPELDSTTELIAGRYQSNWIVTYSMDQADPA